MTKKCPMCRENKESVDFYKCATRHDGISVYCRDCTKKKQRANKEYFRLYQEKKRNSTRRYKKTNIIAKDNSEYNRKYYKKRYLNDSDFRESIIERQKKYRERNKYKCDSRSTLNIAVKRGDIKKEPCVVCGDINSVAHHEDYSKPLSVIWMCQKCHINYHLGNINKEKVLSI